MGPHHPGAADTGRCRKLLRKADVVVERHGHRLVAAANWRRWPIAAALGVAALGTFAIVDAGRSPSVAVGEAILAGAGALTSLACLAGRVRRARTSPAV